MSTVSQIRASLSRVPAKAISPSLSGPAPIYKQESLVTRPPPSRKMQRITSTSHYIKTKNTARNRRRSARLRSLVVRAVKALARHPKATIEVDGESGPEIAAVEEVEDFVYKQWLENIGKAWRTKVEATSEETCTYWSDTSKLIIGLESLSLVDPWSIPWAAFCRKIVATTYLDYDLKAKLSPTLGDLPEITAEWPLTSDEKPLPDEEVHYDPAFHGSLTVVKVTALACDDAKNENSIFDIDCDVFEGVAVSTNREVERYFTFFPALPTELQWKIWNFALPNELDSNWRRIINVRVYAGDEPKLGHFCLNSRVGTSALSTAPNVLDGRLLRVSRDSRQMFLESFKHELQLPPRCKWKRFKVRFTDNTTIYISNFSNVRRELLKAIEQKAQLPLYFSTIRKLALDLQQSIPALFRDDSVYKILLQFQNLKELVVAASDNVCEWFTSKDILWLEGLEKTLETATGQAGKKWKVRKGKIIWTFSLEEG